MTEPTTAETVIDPKYIGNDSYSKPKKEYLDRLAKMNNEELLDATEKMIWLSAYATNNRRSDYHWQCDACYDECKRRTDEPDLYDRAWKQAAGS